MISLNWLLLLHLPVTAKPGGRHFVCIDSEMAASSLTAPSWQWWSLDYFLTLLLNRSSMAVNWSTKVLLELTWRWVKVPHPQVGHSEKYSPGISTSLRGATFFVQPHFFQV